MDTLVIAVGSARRPKLGAVADALALIGERLARGRKVEIVGREVPSGVSHTPTTCSDLMRGARQRAEALARVAREESANWGYLLGLEGGLHAVEEAGTSRVFLESWAYVTNGTRGHFGRSGAVELPEALAEEVLVRGTELSVAVDAFAGAAGIRDGQGAWGVLSGGLVSRQDAFRVAVVAAFAPFYNDHMYVRAAGAATALRS